MEQELTYNKNKYMMPSEIYFTHKEKFDYIELKVAEKLKDYPNYNGLDFSYSAYKQKICVRCFHKQIKRYSFSNYVEFELNNKDYIEAVDVIVEAWKENDIPEKVNSFLRFISDGEEYGWD